MWIADSVLFADASSTAAAFWHILCVFSATVPSIGFPEISVEIWPARKTKPPAFVAGYYIYNKEGRDPG